MSQNYASYSKAAHLAAMWWADRLMSGDKQKSIATLEPLIECDLLTVVHAASLECAGVLFSAGGILPTKHSLIIMPGKLIPKEGYGK